MKLIGALNYDTGHIYCEERKTYGAQAFIGFMKNFLKIYEKWKLIMILDNEKIHHAKITKKFLVQYADKLQIDFFL